SRYDVPSVLAHLERALPGAFFLDATALAAQAGGRRAMNAVMLGAVAGLGLLPMPPEAVRDALLGLVRPAYRELNERAFGLGMEKAMGA
ncbi:MAG: 2-oxoacid:acceptor oxidoreductase family protein, partial [Bacteroidota bacterium]